MENRNFEESNYKKSIGQNSFKMNKSVIHWGASNESENQIQLFDCLVEEITHLNSLILMQIDNAYSCFTLVQNRPLQE